MAQRLTLALSTTVLATLGVVLSPAVADAAPADATQSISRGTSWQNFEHGVIDRRGTSWESLDPTDTDRLTDRLGTSWE